MANLAKILLETEIRRHPCANCGEGVIGTVGIVLDIIIIHRVSVRRLPVRKEAMRRGDLIRQSGCD